MPEKKKRGRKKKRRNSDFESSDSGDSDMSEGEHIKMIKKTSAPMSDRPLDVKHTKGSR